MTTERDPYINLLAKIQRYCAYQDRCHQEVRSKLLSMKVYGKELEELMGDLIQEGFLNEERYAKSYVRGKFRIKRWGRVKIKQKLKQHKISDYCIERGLLEISEEEYATTLDALIQQEITKLIPPINKIKLTKKLMLKGYEYPLVLEALKLY